MTPMTAEPSGAPPHHGGFRLHSLWSGVPRVVWLLAAANLLLLSTWTILMPTYKAPDEPGHVDLVLMLRSEQGWPGPFDRHVSDQVTRSMVAAGYSHDDDPFGPAHRPLPAGEAPPRDARPTFDELGTGEPTVYENQLTHHPPLYYVLGAVPLTVATTLLPAAYEWSHDQVVGALRLYSALLLAPLPLLAFAATRPLLPARPGGHPAAVAAAVVPLGIPTLTHLGGAVNNDNLLILLVGLLTVLLVRAATGDTSVRTAVWVGAIGGAALLTKGFALAIVPWIGAAYLLAAVRVRRLTALGPGVLAGVVAALVGGWWYLRNLAVFGTVQPTSVRAPEPPPEFVPDASVWASFFLQRMAQRYWASFGWDERHLQWWMVWTATAVVAVGLLLALAARRRGDPWSRADIGVLLVPTAALLAIVGWGAWTWYADAGTADGIQGRYLYPGVTGVAVAFALGWNALLRRWTRLLPLVLLAAAVALQAVAFRTVLVYFWGPFGHENVLLSAQAMSVWAPWPLRLQVPLIAALLAATVACGLLLARRALHDDRPPPAPEPARVESPPSAAVRSSGPRESDGSAASDAGR